MSMTVTNEALALKVIEATTAVQDAHETVVEEGKRLRAHMDDPNAHGKDVDATAQAAAQAAVEAHNRGDTPHAGKFSALGHDHDAAYAPAGHNHDAAYAEKSHQHTPGELNAAVPIAKGGTGKTTAAEALAALGGASQSRKISSGSGLTGGGDLSADRTLAVNFGTATGTVCQGNDERLANARTPTAHQHGNITNDGKVGATAGAPLITGNGGAVQAGAFGTAAGQFCQGNDARLSNARAPTAHQHAPNDLNAAVPIAKGGTGKTTAAEALAALGGCGFRALASGPDQRHR